MDYVVLFTICTLQIVLCAYYFALRSASDLTYAVGVIYICTVATSFLACGVAFVCGLIPDYTRRREVSVAILASAAAICTASVAVGSAAALMRSPYTVLGVLAIPILATIAWLLAYSLHEELEVGVVPLWSVYLAYAIEAVAIFGGFIVRSPVVVLAILLASTIALLMLRRLLAFSTRCS